MTERSVKQYDRETLIKGVENLEVNYSELSQRLGDETIYVSQRDRIKGRLQMAALLLGSLGRRSVIEGTATQTQIQEPSDIEIDSFVTLQRILAKGVHYEDQMLASDEHAFGMLETLDTFLKDIGLQRRLTAHF